MSSAVNWKDAEYVAKKWKGAFAIKGIVSVEDAKKAVVSNSEYIRTQILAEELELMDALQEGYDVEIEEGKSTKIALFKLN